jgi:integrase
LGEVFLEAGDVRRVRVPGWFGEDPAVRRWLRKYGSGATRRGFGYRVAKYLQWLRESRGVYLSPSELLKANLENVYGSGPTEIDLKRQHTNWLEEFVSLDGPLGGQSNSYRMTVATAVRSFYKRNDSPLFGDFEVPFNAYEVKLTTQIDVEEARRCITVLPLRSKAICICLLQSGMRISEFLQLKWKMVQAGVEKGELPVKIRLRSDKGREYFTFLGEDGVAALKMYLIFRKSLARRPIQPEDYIFIHDTGSGKHRGDRPLPADYVTTQILRALTAKGFVQRNGEKKWRCDFHPHALRHLFKTECAHAGINPVISEFWMGHDKGIEYAYNHQHELHPEDFVKMYRKVEPYLSITTIQQGLAKEERERLQLLESKLAKVEELEKALLEMKQLVQGRRE